MSDTQTPSAGDEETKESRENSEENSPNEEATSENNEAENAEGTSEEEEESSKSVNYEEKFKNSSREAIRLHKENRQVKAEAAFLKQVAAVSRNPEQLKDIAATDLETADKISQELYGKTYSEKSEETEEDRETRSIVQEEIKRTERKREQDAIAEMEENFFAGKDILPGSEEFRKIMDDYARYTPKSLSEAKRLLEMAYSVNVPQKSVEKVDPDQSATEFTGRKGGGEKDRRRTTEIKRISQEFAVNEDYVKKADQLLTP